MNIIDINVEPNTIEHDHSNVRFNRLFNWTLALVHFEYVEPNWPPFYLEPINPMQVMNLGDTLSF